jgi:hypothetical protein
MLVIRVPTKVVDMVVTMPGDALRLYMYILTSLGLLHHNRTGNILVIIDHLLADQLNIDIIPAYQYLIDTKLIKRSVIGDKSYIIALCNVPTEAELKKLGKLMDA